MSWRRVNRKTPCEVCGKPDFCTFSDDADCCMRCESDTPMANGGWRHLKGNPDYSRPPREYIPPTPPPPLDAPAYWEKHMAHTTSTQVAELGKSLGLSVDALEYLGTIKIPEGWGFPMFDENQKIIGIRTRASDGSKKAITGSKSGIFIPLAGEIPETMYVCEGPSDAAALWDMGFHPVGRPSCLGQEQIVADYLHSKNISKVVICVDNDTKEEAARMVQSGLERLRKLLRIPSVVFVPPVKDMRAMLQRGATKALIESMVKDLRWT